MELITSRLKCDVTLGYRKKWATRESARTRMARNVNTSPPPIVAHRRAIIQSKHSRDLQSDQICLRGSFRMFPFSSERAGERRAHVCLSIGLRCVIYCSPPGWLNYFPGPFSYLISFSSASRYLTRLSPAESTRVSVSVPRWNSRESSWKPGWRGHRTPGRGQRYHHTFQSMRNHFEWRIISVFNGSWTNLSRTKGYPESKFRPTFILSHHIASNCNFMNLSPIFRSSIFIILSREKNTLI